MTSLRAIPARRPAPTARYAEPNRDVCQDAASLSATLREVAVSAHRAVRASETFATSSDPASSLSFDPQQELAEVHGRIVQLQRTLQTQSLEGLIPYVSALRHRVSAAIAR